MPARAAESESRCLRGMAGVCDAGGPGSQARMVGLGRADLAGGRGRNWRLVGSGEKGEAQKAGGGGIIRCGGVAGQEDAAPDGTGKASLGTC